MSAAYLKAKAVLPSVHIPYWCAGKHRFESPAVARDVALRDRGDKGKGETRHSYYCRSCGGYHVGTEFKKWPRFS